MPREADLRSLAQSCSAVSTGAVTGNTHRLISSTIESICQPCSFLRHATTSVVCDTPSTSAMHSGYSAGSRMV